MKIKFEKTLVAGQTPNRPGLVATADSTGGELDEDQIVMDCRGRHMKAGEIPSGVTVWLPGTGTQVGHRP